MKKIIFLAALVVSACGADGEPAPVGEDDNSVTGQAQIGVTGTL